jgi:hypothetical protein
VRPTGVMECWSIGVMGIVLIHHSITPVLQSGW